MQNSICIVAHYKIHVSKFPTLLINEITMKPKTTSEDCDINSQLFQLGYWRKPVARDGTCLFRCLSEQIYHTQAKHMYVRKQIVSYMKNHSADFQPLVPRMDLSDHLYHLSYITFYGGRLELYAASFLFERDVYVYQSGDKYLKPLYRHGYSSAVWLCVTNGNHFDSIYPQGHILASSICQCKYLLITDMITIACSCSIVVEF